MRALRGFGRLSNAIRRFLNRRCKHDPSEVTADILEGDFHGGPGGDQAIEWCRRCGAHRRVFDVWGRKPRYSDWTVPCLFYDLRGDRQSEFRQSLLKIGALVVPYLAAVVGANLLVNHYGPSAAPYIAFGLIGAVLIFRDRFADLVGPRRVLAQSALIGAGALLTFLLNQDAANIAKASVIAFAASEAIEGTLYYAIRRRPWLERAPLSATAGAAVDSVLFITIAFGFSFPIAFGQFVAKVAGAYLWARLIQGVRTRREVLPRNA